MGTLQLEHGVYGTIYGLTGGGHDGNSGDNNYRWYVSAARSNGTAIYPTARGSHPHYSQHNYNPSRIYVKWGTGGYWDNFDHHIPHFK